MKKIFLSLLALTSLTVFGQNIKETQKMTPEMSEFYIPKVKVVTPGKLTSELPIPAPSDAIVLFDGNDLSQWKNSNDTDKNSKADAKWIVKDGVVTVDKKVGDIETKLVFGDFQLHLEWRTPVGIHGEGQGRGNSGIFLQGMYEVQVLDNYENETYVNGQVGSIYKQTPPLANSMRKPGEWNIYDIIYTAPTFKEDGSYRTKPTVTVMLNGVLLQNNTTILGTTPYIGFPEVVKHDKGPIRLQSHGDPSEPLSFRNIWIREL
jgi:hypothetical protein